MATTVIHLEKTKELKDRFPSDADILWLEKTTSTSALVKERVKTARSGSLIVRVADFQTEGRGSRGRTWENCEESLLLSVAIPWNRPIRQTTGLTLLLGAKVIEILKEFGVLAKMKWPNDLYIDGKKFAGLLCETLKTDPREWCLVIGIGMNCRSKKTEYGDVRELMKTVDRVELAKKIVLSFEETVRSFGAEKLKSLRDSWAEIDLWHDREIHIMDENGTCRTGIMKGITDEGYCCALINGEEKVFRNATLREKKT